MWRHSAHEQHIQTNIPTLCNPWLCCIYRTTVTYLWQTDRQTDYLRIQQKNPLSEFFVHKELEYRLGGCRVRILLRPSNFLFQTARGSGATLSECLFLWKNAHHSRIFSGKTTSRFLFERTQTRLVSPGKAWGNNEAFESNHETFRGLSIRDP
jgi:hypothetical protein